MLDFKTGEVFAIDKPYGISSFGALSRARYLLTKTLGHKVKIGHAGTLDPLATGVLVLCTGRCTKQIETFQSHTKEYEATLQLGATTPSYDCEHPVDATYPTAHITAELLAEVLSRFVGNIAQVPPSYSACKVEGKRAYSLRRTGEEVVLKAKDVCIHSIELLRFDATAMQADIRVVCGKGTYIRALARDVGRALNSGAYLTALRRTRVGDFNLSRCVQLDSFQEWLNQQEIVTTI